MQWKKTLLYRWLYNNCLNIPLICGIVSCVTSAHASCGRKVDDVKWTRPNCAKPKQTSQVLSFLRNHHETLNVFIGLMITMIMNQI